MRRRTTIITAALSVGAVVLLFGTLLLLWAFPQMVINNRSADWVREKYLAEELSWKDFDLQIKPMGALKKEIVIRANGVCYEDTGLSICGDMDSTLVFQPFESYAVMFQKLELKAQHLRLKENEEAKSTPLPHLQVLEEVLTAIRINQLEVEAKNVSLLKKKPFNDLSMHLQGSLSGGQSNLELNVRAATTKNQLQIKMHPKSDNALNWNLAWNHDEIRMVIKGAITLDASNGEFDIKAKTPEVHSFLLFLNRTGILVPAPFNQFRGEVDAHVNGRLSPDSNTSFTSQYLIKTNLSSKEQRFISELDGEIHLTKGQWNTTAEIKLLEVHLVAPPLGIKKPPPLIPDSRFVRRVSQEEKVVSLELPKTSPSRHFSYSLRILTKDQPLQLKTQFSKKDLPINFNFLLTDQNELTGWIKLNPVEVELFRRSAQIKRLRVDLRRKAVQSDISGQFSVQYADYLVIIELKGTVEKPYMVLSSNPPLPQDDIYAVLLFGQPLRELGFDETGSTADFQSAMADGALSLASLYFLASTPIEQISYDPESQRFQAKLRLPQGISASIGVEDQQIESLGLKKRLGGGFYLETELKSLLEEDDEVLSTFLQWYKRY